MPFKSEAQRRFLYKNHPEIAKEFESKTPKGAQLPEHVPNSKSKNAKPKSYLDTVKDYFVKKR